MSNKRKFRVGETVYLVDYCEIAGSLRAFSTQANIIQVNEKSRTFIAIVYGDIYQKYSFEDMDV